MIFPQAGDGVARHPSQLYEALGEGLLLFALLWWASRKPRAAGFISGLFCAGYGVARFVVEWFREPDAFLGLQALGLSRGQWLTLPLIVLGFIVMAAALGKPRPDELGPDARRQRRFRTMKANSAFSTGVIERRLPF